MSEEFIEMFSEAALEYGWMDKILDEHKEEGKEEGKEEARAEEKFNFAKKLLAKGMSLEEVCELTELPLEKVLQAQT